MRRLHFVLLATLIFCLISSLLLLSLQKRSDIGYSGIVLSEHLSMKDIGIKPQQNASTETVPQWFRNISAASSHTIDLSTHERGSVKQLFATINGNNLCYKPGILVQDSKQSCVCRPGFSGPHCAVPASVWTHLARSSAAHLRLRSSPRRLVMGLVVHRELEMTEIRFRALGEVVDVFVVAESNVTAGGDGKEERVFLEAFKRGFLKQFHHKIVYVFQDSFPDGYIEDGWLADEYMRTFMSQTGLSRIRGLADDDLFLSFDADEIPKEEVLTFLKIYDGYAEPFLFYLRWTVFGYFWQKSMVTQTKTVVEEMTSIFVGSTVKLLRDCNDDVILIRHAHWDKCQGLLSIDPSRNSLMVGSPGNYAGHHCSWCFSDPSEIRNKLVSAQKNDKPRWGDYPEKLDLDYLEGLVEKGEWFDGSKPTIATNRFHCPDFAPRYVMENPERFEHLLVHPSERKRKVEGDGNGSTITTD